MLTSTLGRPSSAPGLVVFVLFRLPLRRSPTLWVRCLLKWLRRLRPNVSLKFFYVMRLELRQIFMSVCLSHITHWYCGEMNPTKSRRSSPSCSPIILVGHSKVNLEIPTESPRVVYGKAPLSIRQMSLLYKPTVTIGLGRRLPQPGQRIREDMLEYHNNNKITIISAALYFLQQLGLTCIICLITFCSCGTNNLPIGWICKHEPAGPHGPAAPGSVSD